LVETAIYVALGALASALLALLALPAISRRAFRLAQRRAELTAPLSAAEARAERDALRGRHAVDVALIERRAANAQAQWAEAQVALGRGSAELLRRDEALAAKAQEIAALQESLRAREAELADALAERDAAQQRLTETNATLEGARAQAEAARLEEARLRAEIATLAREQDEARRAFARETDEEETSVEPLPRAAALLRGEAADVHERLAEAAARESDLSLRIRALVSGRLETEAALRAARTERDTALRELVRMREADADLREAIARLGHEMVEAQAAPSLVSQP
jgi:chromosome segregation ATPase